MNSNESIRVGLEQSDQVVRLYLQDLSAPELLARACKGANHIAWQLGHLIETEAWVLEKIKPGFCPIPAELAGKYTTATAASDDPHEFLSREKYLELAKNVRARTLALLEQLSADDLDKPISGLPPFISTVGAALVFLSIHWASHAGQWVITRRSLGRPPLV